MDYDTIYVKNIPMSSYPEEGNEFGDDGKEIRALTSKQQSEYLLTILTNKQQQVVKLLLDGYSRKEIAGELGIVLQAVHQIVPRIRRRLIIRGNVDIAPF